MVCTTLKVRVPWNHSHMRDVHIRLGQIVTRYAFILFNANDNEIVVCTVVEVCVPPNHRHMRNMHIG